MYTIISHPGSAHKDDFMSVSVLLAALGDATVFRREPTPEELEDPLVYVVDVGMEYDPARNNFDHHQDSSLPCAFHLIMKHLGHHAAALSMFVWYPHMSMMDVRGPYQTAEHLGVDSGVLFASSSPIDGYILSRFSRIQSLGKGDLLYEFMKSLGQDMVLQLDRKMKRLERLKAEARVVQVKDLKAIVSSIESSPKLAMELYLRFLNDDAVVMSITPAVRGDGWEMLRLGDNHLVDFRALSGEPGIGFIHANGFLAKTEVRLPLEQVIQIASRAVAEPAETPRELKSKMNC